MSEWGAPFFCKYICPQGVLEGAIPLSVVNSGIRSALGALFAWKFSVLIAVIAGKRVVLQTVLQMAVSAWCVLCPFEQGFAVSNESGYRQMCSLRKMRKSLQNGCGRDENA